jgi:hypothetical protein
MFPFGSTFSAGSSSNNDNSDSKNTSSTDYRSPEQRTSTKDISSNEKESESTANNAPSSFAFGGNPVSFGFGPSTFDASKNPIQSSFGSVFGPRNDGFTFGGPLTNTPSTKFNFGVPISSEPTTTTTHNFTEFTFGNIPSQLILSQRQPTDPILEPLGFPLQPPITTPSKAEAEKKEKLFTFNVPQKREDDIKIEQSQPSVNEIASLYGDHVSGDIYLKCKEFHPPLIAHRTILSANSPVFKKIFYNDNKTQIHKVKSTIELNDIDFFTLQALLQHMYTISLKSTYTATEIMNIYDAAAKYELWDLADQCIIVLATSPESGEKLLTPANLCQVWMWAYQRSQRASILLDTCVRLFVAESKAIVTAERFLDWSEEFLMNQFINTINDSIAQDGEKCAKDSFALLLKWSQSNHNQNVERVRRFLIAIFDKCDRQWFQAIPALSLFPDLFSSLLRETDREQPMMNDMGVMQLYRTLLYNFLPSPQFEKK